MNISGTLPNNELDTIVILLISPSNNLVIIKDVQSTGNGEFSIGVNLVEELMKEDGDYTIRVKFQSEPVEKTISFTN